MHIFFVKLCADQTSLRLFGDWHTTPCDFHQQQTGEQAKKQQTSWRRRASCLCLCQKGNRVSLLFIRVFICIFFCICLYLSLLWAKQRARLAGKEEACQSSCWASRKKLGWHRNSAPSSVTAHHHQQEQQKQVAIICEHLLRFVTINIHTHQIFFWKISPAPRGRYKGVAKSSSCVGHLRSHQFGIGGRADFLRVAPYV